MSKKKKIEGDRVLLQFANSEQAEVFFNWFKEYGFDHLCDSDMVHDGLPVESYYDYISSDELPGSCSDESCYYIEIE